VRIEAARCDANYFAADLSMLRGLNVLPAGATWPDRWKAEVHRSMMSYRLWQVSAAQCGWYLYADSGILKAVLHLCEVARSGTGAPPNISSAELMEVVIRSGPCRRQTGKLSTGLGGQDGAPPNCSRAKTQTPMCGKAARRYHCPAYLAQLWGA
jgi:hypothetical protein